MKLSIAVICTILVALVATTAMVDADQPTLTRRDSLATVYIRQKQDPSTAAV
ncbi:hypothetical protein BDF19DRAFT_421030 [Syncephalis fuscata]|nr:hypothetical protein BDF19DRAFT_421030 [Syncephalis fuscata]